MIVQTDDGQDVKMNERLIEKLPYMQSGSIGVSHTRARARGKYRKFY